QASLHFCSECNSLLYPKADPQAQRRIMVYACRICTYDDIGGKKCVYRNDLLTVTNFQVGVTTDLGTEPTLASPSLRLVPYCKYQDQSKRKETRRNPAALCNNTVRGCLEDLVQVVQHRCCAKQYCEI
ncbi:hypothetical protein B0H19DRAFT_921563, partial [Mycena capillaripes]